MVKTTKKKLHLGVKPIGGPSMKSRRVARRVTSMYHSINQSSALIEKDETLTGEEKEQQLSILQTKLKDMGGIEKYQEASFISTQHFQTSKWIVQQLRRLERLIPKQKLKTLEIGAINAQLSNSPHLQVRAIDINSRLPCVEECNFFDVPPKQEYEVVVCSMVMNCCFDPCQRGEMLGRLLMQLQDKGLLFFILPKRCMTTVNMENEETFLFLIKLFGFELVDPPHYTPRLIFLILRRNEGLYSAKVMKKIKQEAADWILPIRSVLKQTMGQLSEAENALLKKYFLNKETIRDMNEFGITIPPLFLQA